MKSVQVFWKLSRVYPGLVAKCAFWLLIDAVFALFSVVTVVPLADLILQRPQNEWLAPTKKIATIAGNLGIPFTILTVAILIAISMFGLAIMGTVVRWITQKARHKVAWNLTKKFYTTMYGSGWEYFSNAKSGYLLNTVISELRLVGSGLYLLASSSAIIFRVIAFLIVPFTISPILTISCITACILFTVPFMFIGKASYKYGDASAKSANDFAEISKAAIDGAKETIVFGKKEHTIENLRQTYKKYAKAMVSSQTLAYAAPQFFEPFGFLAIASILFVFGDIQNVNLAEVGVVLWGMMRAIPSMKQFIQLKHQLDNTLPRLEQANKQLDNAFLFVAGEGSNDFQGFNNSIRFENVKFKYADTENYALNSADIVIPKGEIIALVGESGSGKSTVVDTLAGLLKPESGKVLIDDQSINDMKIDEWRERIGYVPQSPVLFDMSIRENLLWANLAATDKEMIEACDISGVNRFLGEMKNGLDTVIGDSGLRISGGQAQRIALARALVRNPELLILDEATSSLDSENEMSIFDDIYEKLGEMTILVVAHRIATIVRANSIYVMRNAKIVGHGSYQSLLETNDYFSNLVKLQRL